LESADAACRCLTRDRFRGFEAFLDEDTLPLGRREQWRGGTSNMIRKGPPTWCQSERQIDPRLLAHYLDEKE
jgi:hypothetical protein